MTTLSFRLPAKRIDRRPLRHPVSQRPLDCGQIGRPAPTMRAMDAEAAALIALRRLGAAELQARLASEMDEIAPSGWFDSTWELAQGLDIAEGLPADLPLDGWLQFYLAA